MFRNVQPVPAVIISPVLRQLHWLTVRQHVAFKIATLVCRTLSGNASGYLADDCQLVADAGVRQLRSADTRTLVSQTRAAVLKTGPLPPLDHKSGTVCRPIRLCGLTCGQFRRLLKIFLFGQ